MIAELKPKYEVKLRWKTLQSASNDTAICIRLARDLTQKAVWFESNYSTLCMEFQVRLFEIAILCSFFAFLFSICRCVEKLKTG